MGFLKSLGTAVGDLTGGVLGGVVSAIGEASGSDFLKEVGQGVHRATRATGELLGDAAEGAVSAVEGLLDQDDLKINAGLGQLGGAVGRTAQGVGHTVGGLVQNGGKVIDGFVNDDANLAMDGLRAVAKTALVGAIAIGVTDAVLDFDGGTDASLDDHVSAELNEGVDLSDDNAEAGGPGLHHVDPHMVSGYVTANGTEVADYWRDGDGDTSVDRSLEQGGGYWRTNPDGDPTNNLS